MKIATRFLISLVNGPRLEQVLCASCGGSGYALQHEETDRLDYHRFKPEYVAAKSVRRSRAIKEARRMAQTNGNVMLWGKNQETGQWYRISIRKGTHAAEFAELYFGNCGNPHNAVQVGFTADA